MAKEKPGAMIYWDTFEALEALKPEKLKIMMQAIYNFARYGEEPDFAEDETLAFGWPGIRRKLILDDERFETKREQRIKAVNTRWERERARKAENESIRANTEVYERIRNIPHTNTDTHTDTNTNTETEREEKPTRHKYGEYGNVLLTGEDLKKLKAEFPGDWERRINRLSEYIASTGKTYKNHLATIRAWAKKDKEEGVKQDAKRNAVSDEWGDEKPDCFKTIFERPFVRSRRD